MRLLLVGDSLRLSTGFAQVLRPVAAAARARGWDVAQIAGLERTPFVDRAAYDALGVTPYWPSSDANTGMSVAGEVIAHYTPDVALVVADPGYGGRWMQVLEALAPTVARVLYAPLEGGPPAPGFLSAYRLATRAATATDWAAAQLTELGYTVTAIPHGVNTDVFTPLPPAERAAWRTRLGLDGRYVIAYVARNAGRKQQPRLIQALAHLRANGADDDALLYLHCAPFDDYWNRGWNLQQTAVWCGVPDHVRFHDGAALTGETQASLAVKYGCADLYVHVAQVEGFGLPILEALASGLPVMIPADRGNMMEVVGASVRADGTIDRGAAAAVIPPRDREVWFTGAELCNLDPRTLAAAIYGWRHNTSEDQKAAVRAAARTHAMQSRWSWPAMAAQLLTLCEEAADEGARTPEAVLV